MSDAPTTGTQPDPRPAGRECQSGFADAVNGVQMCARWSTHLGIHRTADGRLEWLDDGTPIRQEHLVTVTVRVSVATR